MVIDSWLFAVHHFLSNFWQFPFFCDGLCIVYSRHYSYGLPIHTYFWRCYMSVPAFTVTIYLSTRVPDSVTLRCYVTCLYQPLQLRFTGLRLFTTVLHYCVTLYVYTHLKNLRFLTSKYWTFVRENQTLWSSHLL